jgi:hypothetical protein
MVKANHSTNLQRRPIQAAALMQVEAGSVSPRIKTELPPRRRIVRIVRETSGAGWSYTPQLGEISDTIAWSYLLKITCSSIKGTMWSEYNRAVGTLV